MDNILLKIKEILEETKDRKQKEKNKLSQDIAYIKEYIKKTQEKFYELMENKTTILEFKKLIENKDNTIIYTRETSTLRHILNEMEREISKNKIQEFYNELSHLFSRLNLIISLKENEITKKTQEIKIISEITNNINENGEFIEPLASIDYTQKLIRTLEYIKKEYLEEEIIDKLYLEITEKNNKAIRRFEAIKNAELIKQKRDKKQNQQPLIKITPPTLNDEQQKIYDTAQQILENNKEKIGTLSEIEEGYLDDLKKCKAQEKESIETCISLMDTLDRSIVLIINAINEQQKNISQETLQDDIKKISIFIEQYKNYSIKKQEEEQIQNKIIELEKLKKEIEEALKTEQEEIFSDLTPKQHTLLESFKEIKNINEISREYDDIKKTLENEGLNIEFLLLYNKYKEIEYNLEYYSILTPKETKEKTKLLEQIIEHYKQYKEIKEIIIKNVEENTEQLTEEIVNKTGNNVLLYLTDETNTTYVEEFIKSSKQYITQDYNNTLALINVLKNTPSKLIQTSSKKVKPDDPIYKKKRVDKGQIRLIFLELSSKPLQGEKNVYLVITAGIKTESKNAPIYALVNKDEVKKSALEFQKMFEKLSKEEAEKLIKEHQEIEKLMLEHINPRKKTIEGEQNGRSK